MNWLPVFHLHWLGHVPHVRQHLPTTIVWNSPMRELIGSVMVFSPLLLTFGTLSLLLYFRLPTTFLPSKGRSITTLGTRWHDFFITLFRYFTIVLFFTLHFFSFSQGMQTRERAHCGRSVFPFIKKEKKKNPRLVENAAPSIQLVSANSGKRCIISTPANPRIGTCSPSSARCGHDPYHIQEGIPLKYILQTLVRHYRRTCLFHTWWRTNLSLP